MITPEELESLMGDKVDEINRSQNNPKGKPEVSLETPSTDLVDFRSVLGISKQTYRMYCFYQNLVHVSKSSYMKVPDMVPISKYPASSAAYLKNGTWSNSGKMLHHTMVKVFAGMVQDKSYGQKFIISDVNAPETIIKHPNDDSMFIFGRFRDATDDEMNGILVPKSDKKHIELNWG
jgi:hypothetical protein